MAASLPSLATQVQRRFSSFGLPDDVRLAPLRLAKRIAGRSAYRRWTHPYLYEFQALTRSAFPTPDDILATSGATLNSIVGLRDEFEALGQTLRERCTTRQLIYPSSWAMSDQSLFLLYALVRLRGAKAILETGVADGYSTYYLLAALRANGTGRLCSLDVRADVGVLLDSAEREGWSYVRLHAGRERKGFQACVEEFGPFDVFLHDSDHTYGWQAFEYRSVWERLARGGLLLSDNIDHSFAFMDFCAERNLEPKLLVSLMKIFGVVEVNH